MIGKAAVSSCELAAVRVLMRRPLFAPLFAASCVSTTSIEIVNEDKESYSEQSGEEGSARNLA